MICCVVSPCVLSVFSIKVLSKNRSLSFWFGLFATLSPFAGSVPTGDLKQDPLLGLIVARATVVFAAIRARIGRKVVKRKSAVWLA